MDQHTRKTLLELQAQLRHTESLPESEREFVDELYKEIEELLTRPRQELPAHVAAVEDAFVDGVPLGRRELGIGLRLVCFHGVPRMVKRERPPVRGGTLWLPGRSSD